MRQQDVEAAQQVARVLRRVESRRVGRRLRPGLLLEGDEPREPGVEDRGVEVGAAHDRQQRRRQPLVLGVGEDRRAGRRHLRPGGVQQPHLIGGREARVPGQELQQVGRVGGGVDPADLRLQPAQVALVAQVGERVVEQLPVPGVVERGIGVLEGGEDREVERREGPEQGGVGAALADAAAQVVRQPSDELAPLLRRQPLLLVDAARHDAVADVVAPLRVGRAEEGHGLAHETEGRLPRRHRAVPREREPERLPALLGRGRLGQGRGDGDHDHRPRQGQARGAGRSCAWHLPFSR